MIGKALPGPTLVNSNEPQIAVPDLRPSLGAFS
jgi:hypothetical protein